MLARGAGLLNTILFSLDPGLATLVRSIADESVEFTLERLVDSQPTGFEISRTLGTTNADVILLEVANTGRDIVYAEAIHTAAAKLPIVALTDMDIGNGLEAHPGCGIAGTLRWPFTVADFETTLQRVVRGAAEAHHPNLIAFLPGKAGSGASTTVMNTADMLAGHLKKRVLVIEADLHSGLFATILGAKPPRGIRQALHGARTMELPDWEQCLVRSNGVDYLVTNTAVKEPAPSWSDYFQLLRFVLPRYDFVLADLPEVIDAATAEIVRTADAVYMVTTPELPSLALSRQRCQDLVGWGVEGERLFAILNRWHEYDLPAGDVEKVLHHPVAATVGDDNRMVQKAIAEGKMLGADNDLGAAFLKLACMLAGETYTDKNKQKAGLFNLFRAS